MGALDRIGALAALQIGGCNEDHRQVHGACDQHRHANIPARDPQKHPPHWTRVGVSMTVAGQAGV
jgi:hypothetical protein